MYICIYVERANVELKPVFEYFLNFARKENITNVIFVQWIFQVKTLEIVNKILTDITLTRYLSYPPLADLTTLAEIYLDIFRAF